MISVEPTKSVFVDLISPRRADARNASKTRKGVRYLVALPLVPPSYLTFPQPHLLSSTPLLVWKMLLVNAFESAERSTSRWRSYPLPQVLAARIVVVQSPKSLSHQLPALVQVPSSRNHLPLRLVEHHHPHPFRPSSNLHLSPPVATSLLHRRLLRPDRSRTFPPTRSVSRSVCFVLV